MRTGSEGVRKRAREKDTGWATGFACRPESNPLRWVGAADPTHPPSASAAAKARSHPPRGSSVA